MNYKKSLVITLICILIITFLQFSTVAQNNNQGIIYEIPIKGSIDLGLAKFISRGIQEAETSGAQAILLEIDTFGGLVKAATEIRDDILATELPVIAYVKNRAWSAGALITIASDQIFMNPGSSIGAAETRPKEEKIISAFRKEFEATAEKTKRDPKLAAAMVDARVEIEEIVDKGQILTLTAQQADKLNFITGIANNKQEVLTEAGYGNKEVKVLKSNLKENLARFTSNPVISTILLTIGFLALIIEGITLGWGGAGSIGVLALGLYFAGRLIAGTTGLGLILIFILGIFLLALEVLVVPGFGVTGIGGIVAILGSLFFTFENHEVAMYVLTISVAASVVGLIIALKYFVKSTAWSRIELSATQTKEEGYLSNQTNNDLLAKQGKTITPLRPAGIAEIDGERLDVVSEGGFVAAGQDVEVVIARGRRIVVKEI
jgi:membrane-bound serine protease (ClpP class)